MKLKFLLFTAMALTLGAWTYPDPCAQYGTSIVVTTANKRLFVCENGQAQVSYRAAFGRGGLGKQVEGDNKTPLGTYALGKPRSSNDFHTFIPVGYPTKEQKKGGFTGSDIGIHGPKVPYSNYPYLAAIISFFNWTEGCIAVSQNNIIDAIANWVSEHPSAQLHVLK